MIIITRIIAIIMAVSNLRKCCENKSSGFIVKSEVQIPTKWKLEIKLLVIHANKHRCRVRGGSVSVKVVHEYGEKW